MAKPRLTSPRRELRSKKVKQALYHAGALYELLDGFVPEDSADRKLEIAVRALRTIYTLDHYGTQGHGLAAAALKQIGVDP